MELGKFQNAALLATTRGRKSAENPFREIVAGMKAGVEHAISVTYTDKEMASKNYAKDARLFRKAVKEGRNDHVPRVRVFENHPEVGNCLALWMTMRTDAEKL